MKTRLRMYICFALVLLALAGAVTDIEVRLLPAADRETLAAGLSVESREELLLLLEDLGS